MMRKDAFLALKSYIFLAPYPGDPWPNQRKIRRALARSAAQNAYRLGHRSITGIQIEAA